MTKYCMFCFDVEEWGAPKSDCVLPAKMGFVGKHEHAVLVKQVILELAYKGLNTRSQ